MTSKTSGNSYYRGPVSDHFDGKRFFNPGGVEPGGLSKVLQWRLRDKPERWPSSVPSPFAETRPETRMEGHRLRVTMVGHASMLIQTGGFSILTDPVWSERVSPFSFAGPQRANQPGIRFEDLPPIDVVIVSHNHYDHMDIATLKRLVRLHNPLIITPLGNDAIMGAAIPHARVKALDWGDRFDFGQGLVFHAEPAHHWSARGVNDRCFALWAAFVIETPGGLVYHVGDTGFHQGINYRAAAEKYGRFRLAILPIGAYEPRWFMKGQHQNPEEAVEGMRLCNAAYAAGHHWFTFQLTNENVLRPQRDLHIALDAAGIARERFPALQPGEIFDVPEVCSKGM
jgi:L-ascorbate metabolism protein UlaG (beta-lactamase superfamily)